MVFLVFIGLNKAANSNIKCNVGTQLTSINLSGLSIYKDAWETIPYKSAGVYYI